MNMLLLVNTGLVDFGKQGRLRQYLTAQNIINGSSKSTIALLDGATKNETK